MFSFFKPAHVTLRNMLSPPVAKQYDEVVEMFSESVPSYWSKHIRDCTITLVMAEWATANSDAGRILIHNYAYKKAENFYEICSRTNERDSEHGMSSTIMAEQLRGVLTKAGIIPEDR